MFVNKLRQVREAKGLSQLELSCLTKISSSAISLLEAGK